MKFRRYEAISRSRMARLPDRVWGRYWTRWGCERETEKANRSMMPMWQTTAYRR
jgi:hypothetical protein